MLNAAVALIAARGLDGWSMREVARRAGVSHQAPYHHFGDREGVLAAICEEGFRALAAGFEALPAKLEPVRRLELSGQLYVRFAASRPGHFRVMFRPDAVDLSGHPAAKAQADRAFAAFTDIAHGCVDAARDLAEEELRLLAWSVVHGAAVLLLDGPGPVDPDAALRVPSSFRRLLSGPRRNATVPRDVR